MARHGPAPGFFGKLPSHGDFVGRRLPPGVRRCLDEWLQGALVQSRIDLGPAWLATWGSSPIWRFVIGAGVCGDEAWAGVMMPSADRVGRCFPLLLAGASACAPRLDACLTDYGDWFERLEALALSALEQGRTLDTFDAALSVAGAAPCSHNGTAIGLAPAQARAMARRAHSIQALAALSLAGQSVWWTEGSPTISQWVALCPGLPAPSGFAALLDGRFAERGWIIET